ncbi:cyclic nucleotide-binding domain-containing protein [Chondromyces apiculatus]|nr:cyclic nucleotide-binding domain-containing protein [Chondromyces apiculatus]
MPTVMAFAAPQAAEATATADVTREGHSSRPHDLTRNRESVGPVAVAPLHPSSAPHLTPPPKPEEAPTETLSAGLTAHDLVGLDAFADLPEEMHVQLARSARVEALTPDEEVAGFGVALVLSGEASVCTSIVDTPALQAEGGTLVPSCGTLAEGMPLRVVAGPKGARVAVWDQPAIDEAIRACPWVVDELREVSDRLQAFAGATIGPLGDLEESQLHHVLERLRIQALEPGETIVLSGHPVPGLVVVGAGTVEFFEQEPGPASAAARPGDILFASALLSGQESPATARAATGGALVLIGEHPTLRALFEQFPELLHLLSTEI